MNKPCIGCPLDRCPVLDPQECPVYQKSRKAEKKLTTMLVAFDRSRRLEQVEPADFNLN